MAHTRMNFLKNLLIHTSNPILLSKSSTVFGGPSWLFCILCEVTDFCLCSEDLRTCRSGSSSTFMNLKWPIRPWQRPRQSPLGFMAMMSIVSPRCLKMNIWTLCMRYGRISNSAPNRGSNSTGSVASAPNGGDQEATRASSEKRGLQKPHRPGRLKTRFCNGANNYLEAIRPDFRNLPLMYTNFY